MVIYRLVQGFSGYRAGDDGSVWSCRKNTQKAEVVDGWHQVKGKIAKKDGYRYVSLCGLGKSAGWSGKSWWFRVNVLILRVFRGPPPKGMKYPTAAHENGNRRDNRLSNLRWKTLKDNIADKVRHGTLRMGDNHPSRIREVGQEHVLGSGRRGRDHA